MSETWTCPNCGYENSTGLLNPRVCDRCGWSDEDPPDDDPPGYA